MSSPGSRLALLAACVGLLPAPALGTLASPMLEGVERVDRALLPPLPGPISVRVHALAAVVHVEAPQAVASLTRALRLSPLALCPEVEETVAGVTLHCRSRRIVAHLGRGGGGHVLDVSETRGLPWDGEDGPPLVPLDAVAATSRGCEGAVGPRRAECLLDAGDRAGARAVLAGLTGPAADGLAALRLGDLALADGDVVAATSHWSRARGRPWEHLAAARLCELSWACLAGSSLEALYATGASPAWAARDLDVRHARALAFLGRSAQAVLLLAGSEAAMAGCSAAPSLCRDVAAEGLSATGPESLDALALWLTIPGGSQAPAVWQETVAAAAVAEGAGAPLFAAQLLAAAVGKAPPRALRDHLLRTAELFAAGGDPVRAGVVVEFARAHAPGRRLAGQRWETVLRTLQDGIPGPGGGAR